MPPFSVSRHPSRLILLPRPAVIHRRKISSPTMSLSPSPALEQDPGLLDQVVKYHNQTKHAFNNYARGPHGLDWANQPNPFRRYVSAPLVALFHFPTDDGSGGGDAPAYSAVFRSLPPPKPISKSTISQLFYDSLALSAWKTTGFSTWSLRVNPSSGNLHPTEAYVIAPPIDTVSISPFVAHYAPKEHSLEIRAQIPAGFFPEFFPQGSFLVGISSIFWREA